MDNKEFLITTIIPVYNLENYLEETVESVLNQTISFKDNIQLILLNKFSSDGSKEIISNFKEKYSKSTV